MDIPLAGAAKPPHIHHFAECIHNTSDCDGSGVELCNYSRPMRLFRTMRGLFDDKIHPQTCDVKSRAGVCPSLRHVIKPHRWLPKARLWIMHADIQRCWLHAFLMLIFRYYTSLDDFNGRETYVSKQTECHYGLLLWPLMRMHGRPLCFAAVLFFERRRSEVIERNSNQILPHVRQWARFENGRRKFGVPFPP